MSLAILELFIKISNKQFSSTIITKHLLLEYHNYIPNEVANLKKIKILKYKINLKFKNNRMKHIMISIKHKSSKS